MSKMSYVSIFVDPIEDLGETIDVITGNDKYSSLITSVIHPKLCRFSAIYKQRVTRSPLIISSDTWINKTILKVNLSDIDCDSENEFFKSQSEEILRKELNLIDHLTIASNEKSLLLDLPMGDSTNLAKIMSENIKGIITVAVPLVDPESESLIHRVDCMDEEKESRIKDTWKVWNNFRENFEYPGKLKVALEIPADIPSNKKNISRWFGESVGFLIIPSSIFISNQSNYPVISKAHQELIRHFMKINKMGFIVRTNTRHDPRIRLYAEYLHHLSHITTVPDTMTGYDDFLEIPLQPLYDNLDFSTYEIFERDPIKYLLYQKAIEAALVDRVPEEKVSEVTVYLMVVGAGRGPLIRAALNASANTRRKLKVYAIEKNPNAISILTALIEEMWQDKDVTLVSTDMRDFEMTEKADILVSELLGSFGDNELSPECLDGAQQHLKPDGISIPSKSTSYLRPIMSSKLHTQLKNSEKTSNNDIQYYRQNVHEFGYVVYLKNYFGIDVTKELFNFVHPNRDAEMDNTRCKTMTFKSSVNCRLTGFAGYFDAVLYKNIIMSIHPETHTRGLASWFAMYFPLEVPQNINAGDEIKLTFWRKVDPNKVWYEWKLIAPKISKIHNHKGHSQQLWK